MSIAADAEIEARRTAVAMVRAAVYGDVEAGAVLMATVEDMAELRLALVGLARGLVAVNPALPPPPSADSPVDGIVAYVGQHLDGMARSDGSTAGSILDRLALIALGA